MYAIPLKRLVLLHVIRRTSRTLPTLEKNSSRSRALIRCDSCIQNTVRASLSSGVSSSGGDRFPKPFGGVRPRRNGRGGDGDRRLLLKVLSDEILFTDFLTSLYLLSLDRLRLRSPRGDRRSGDFVPRRRSFDRLRLLSPLERLRRRLSRGERLRFLTSFGRLPRFSLSRRSRSLDRLRFLSRDGGRRRSRSWSLLRCASRFGSEYLSNSLLVRSNDPSLSLDLDRLQKNINSFN